MASGYGAVYELRDLPKAVHRKFISEAPAIETVARMSVTRHHYAPKCPYLYLQVKFHSYTPSTL